MVVKDSKVTFWKDYWCYRKYKAKTSELFGDSFSMFKSKRRSKRGDGSKDGDEMMCVQSLEIVHRALSFPK